MSRWPLALVSLTMGVVLAGCASRHIDAAPAKSSAVAQTNATVRKVTYFAAWVDERAAAPPTAAALAPALTPAREPADKRAAARSKSAVRQAEAAPRPPAAAKAAAPAPAQPRYEYGVELDSGGYQTVVGERDLGVRVNDRVLVQGNRLTPPAN